MTHFDRKMIQAYINDNPIEMSPKMFRDNIIICNGLTFVLLGLLNYRGLLFWLSVLFDLSYTIIFFILKKHAKNIVSYYLCQGMTFLYISFFCYTLSYLFYTDIHGMNFRTTLSFVLLYAVFFMVAVWLELCKINSIKRKNRKSESKKVFLIIPATLGIIVAQFVGANFMYNQTLEIASVVGAVLSFIFLLGFGYIIKAYFIIVSNN